VPLMTLAMRGAGGVYSPADPSGDFQSGLRLSKGGKAHKVRRTSGHPSVRFVVGSTSWDDEVGKDSRGERVIEGGRLCADGRRQSGKAANGRLKLSARSRRGHDPAARTDRLPTKLVIFGSEIADLPLRFRKPLP